MKQYFDKQMPGHDRPAYRPKAVHCLNCDYETTEDEIEDNNNKCPSCGEDDFRYLN